MNDQRNLTIGVDFGLKDSINQLESIYGSIQGIKAGFQGAEDSGVQMGSRVAKSLVSKEFVDWISLSNDYSMVEIVVPQNWVGKSLVDLGVRERLGINVVGIIKNGKIEVAINPQEPLREKEILIVIGYNDILEKFDMKNR